MDVLGLMSGTSADGVDGVLARFEGPVASPRWRLLERAYVPYPQDLRDRLIAFGQGVPSPAGEVLELAEAVTEQQAKAAKACDSSRRATLIGCHGQTVWHRPPEGDRRGCSWQLLQPTLLATLLGRPVVHDFRAADLAVGGQGAPLVPPADAALLGAIDGWRAVLNLGGIANLTMIPPLAGPDRHRSLEGWDCGPANTLVDLAVEQFTDGRLHFDAGGQWGLTGQVNESLLNRWLQEPYFQQPPPKSTGRELFGHDDLERRLHELQASADATHHSSAGLNPADAVATLTALSAAVVAQDLSRGPRPVELLAAGGGARNALLMEQLRLRCRGVIVRPLQAVGLEDSDREALAFALLAWWHVRGHPGNAPSVTGARQQTVLGLCACPPAPHSVLGGRCT